ncbi:MAG TPA: triose-phosphate isomerase [Euryarchaeota archaeon]|nr:MAG: triose-phosphate isomerase [Thermoplasmata archaeon]HHD15496.1 triose-phosphate isomerase [Euryarchaeota archaeon]
MDLPVIILNFKTYSQLDGRGTLELARLCQDVHDETGASIAVCPPHVELARVASEVSIPVLAQNADIWDGSVRTGGVTLSQLKGIGASGLLINHSERRRTLFDMEALITGSREMGLTSIVCTNNVNSSRAAAAMEPDFVAMEPPELIGGDISVTSADPGIVKRTVDEVARISPGVRVLTGAGVKTGEDVAKALELGTHGVLLASGVVKASDPGTKLRSLIDGLSR